MSTEFLNFQRWPHYALSPASGCFICSLVSCLDFNYTSANHCVLHSHTSDSGRSACISLLNWDWLWTHACCNDIVPPLSILCLACICLPPLTGSGLAECRRLQSWLTWADKLTSLQNQTTILLPTKWPFLLACNIFTHTDLVRRIISGCLGHHRPRKISALFLSTNL